MSAHHRLHRRALLQGAGALGIAAALPQMAAAKAALYANSRALYANLGAG